ncbi:Hint domain-containing protein [Ovoidimarina sediminis]|uniref:Hint domain-containing protein n=1 Tax=Ovoidimarina sediminis TaxID=3079856 RepID=UPI002910552A|nr:Hint domain-containing protein [Rhodophyticola sp. MJ-SS7]MDU8941989.1 Hint domain-containing protein [Rhodophyticola sp. MJ-SS7]
MAKVAVWEFGEEAEFDGSTLFAEVCLDPGVSPRAGTLELVFATERLHRSAIFAHGVPGRDAGAFTFVLTHAGAVSLSCTDGSGTPFRLRSPEGFVAIGERVQLTLSAGNGGTFTAVNLDRRDRDPFDPAAGFVAALPLRARVDLRGTHKFTFGAAAGGVAPFFHGRIETTTLSDSIDAPTIAPPSAQVHHIDFAQANRVAPRRVPPRPASMPRGPEEAVRHGSLRSLRVTTSEGVKPLWRLETGDEVLTRDHGLQTVEWVQRVDLDWQALRKAPALRPVVIRRGCLGPGLPEDDITLSPCHRLLPPLGRSGDDPALISAEQFCAREKQPLVEAMGVSYVHFFCAEQVLVQINGLWIEAFHPGRTARGPGAADRRREILTLFPDLAKLERLTLS